MALGDGITWDETLPSDSTTAVSIDDHIKDVRKGIRYRMALEHEFPSSQSVASEAGVHKFITLQNQAAKPTLAGTQVGAVYAKTSALYFEDSAGVEIQITTGTGMSIPPGGVVQVVNSLYGAVATGSTAIPFDDTVPQNTEGTEFMSLAITPTGATNKLKIDVVFMGGLTLCYNGSIAIFQDTTAGAKAAFFMPNVGYQSMFNASFTHFMEAGTVGATTFKVRAGLSSATEMTFNGVAGARYLGGALASSITITEIKV
jgi:hypothetical protein